MPPTLRDVQPILAHAVEHLDEDSSLAVLAERAGMSPWHFHRTFSAVAGETPKQVIQRLRLGRAAGLLLSTRLTILDIALTCGFQSHEVFCRAFRRLFKLAPLVYRERGLVNAAHVAHARSHADLVNKMGPCIGFYHMVPSAHLKENDMPYSIVKQKLDPQPVLVVRRRVKRSEIAPTIGEALPHIFMYAQQHGIALSGLPFTRYVEMGPGLITMEPGMRIAADPKIGDLPVTAADGVLVDSLPGGLAGPRCTSGHTTTSRMLMARSSSGSKRKVWLAQERRGSPI